ncbi:hypothetical protein BST61_g524 [Cercospora zeina]
MFSPRGLALLAAALSGLLACSPAAQAAAAPAPQADSAAAAASSYWLATISREGGTVWGGNDTSYKIFRNVKDFGAKGDGATDDTEAINTAISSGNRCGQDCESSTILPAIVYFPPGTYRVSKPVIMYYYTQMIGDAVEKPTIQSTPDFAGMAVLDSDPYDDTGKNWQELVFTGKSPRPPLSRTSISS